MHTASRDREWDRQRDPRQAPPGRSGPAAEHRDAVISAIFRFFPEPVEKRVTGAVVVGPGVAWRHTTHEQGADTDVLVCAATVGFDVPIRVRTRLAVVPSMRFHYLFDDDRANDSPIPQTGVSNVLLRFAVSAETRW